VPFPSGEQFCALGDTRSDVAFDPLVLVAVQQRPDDGVLF
jgi:hypothetical protein